MKPEHAVTLILIAIGLTWSYTTLSHKCQPEQAHPHYYYTVGHEVKAYLGGQGVEIKAYQEAVGVKPDGKFGYDTCTATNFYNAQRKDGVRQMSLEHFGYPCSEPKYSKRFLAQHQLERDLCAGCGVWFFKQDLDDYDRCYDCAKGDDEC